MGYRGLRAVMGGGECPGYKGLYESISVVDRVARGADAGVADALGEVVPSRAASSSKGPISARAAARSEPQTGTSRLTKSSTRSSHRASLTSGLPAPSRRGALDWSPDGGWERTDWHTLPHEDDAAAIG